MILTVTLNAAIDKRYVVDDFKAGEVNRVRECSYVPGGKGLNVSKPASIYGAEVVATGFVGGHAGNYIEDALKPFGIKGEFYHVDAESRSCINIWDEVNHVQTEFLEPGFTVTEEQFQGFLKKFRNLVKQADVIARKNPTLLEQKNVNGVLLPRTGKSITMMLHMDICDFDDITVRTNQINDLISDVETIIPKRDTTFNDELIIVSLNKILSSQEYVMASGGKQYVITKITDDEN